MDAENAYLFRHAVLRDAAYGLQLPAERARLHELAFHLIEQALGGRAPQPPVLDEFPRQKFSAHAIDLVAAELADHARQAGGLGGMQRLYLQRAAEIASLQFSVQAARLWQELAALETGVARSQALRHAADTLLRCGQPAQAEELLQQALELARQAGHAQAEIGALSDLAGLWRTTGRIAAALEQSRQNLRALTLLKDQGAMGTVQAQVGLLLAASGRLAEANEELQAAARRQAELADESGLAYTLVNTCGVLRELGQRQAAAEAGTRALGFARASGERQLEALALAQLSLANSSLGLDDKAEELIHQSLAIFTEHGDRRNCGKVLSQVAAICLRTARMEQALAAMEQSLALARDQGERYEEAFSLGNLAVVYIDLGRIEQAQKCASQALELHRALGSRRGEGIALRVLGDGATAAGQFDQAQEHYQKAQEVLQEVGDIHGRAVALGNLADVYRRAGKMDLAGKGFDQALALHRELQDRRFEGATMCDRALWLLAMHNAAGAKQQWLAGAEILRQVGDTDEVARKTTDMRQACAQAGVAAFEGAVS